jgi:hypothetical protein
VAGSGVDENRESGEELKKNSRGIRSIGNLIETSLGTPI